MSAGKRISTHEVLGKLANGSTVKQIAAENEISTYAIWQRIKRLHKRHGAKTTVQLIFLLTKQGRLK